MREQQKHRQWVRGDGDANGKTMCLGHNSHGFVKQVIHMSQRL